MFPTEYFDSHKEIKRDENVHHIVNNRSRSLKTDSNFTAIFLIVYDT